MTCKCGHSFSYHKEIEKYDEDLHEMIYFYGCQAIDCECEIYEEQEELTLEEIEWEKGTRKFEEEYQEGKK